VAVVGGLRGWGGGGRVYDYRGREGAREEDEDVRMFLGGGREHSMVVVLVETICWLVPLLISGKAMF